MIDLTTTNVLLGILAAVALVELIGLIVTAVMVSRAWRRGLERLEQLEQNIEAKMSPIAVRAETFFDRVDRVSERVEVGAQKLDTALAVTARGAGVALAAVNGRVRRTAMLAAALASGGRAALQAWRSGDRRRSPQPLTRFESAAVNNNVEFREEHHVSI